MDKENVKGAAKKAEGSLKEATGKAIGDKSLEMKGKADKAEGKVREKVGDTKDKIRKTF
ncbi:MAG TPA: CsbD family protein [Hyphomonas sp.]|nr:CsbD family protein [Hyphomonas sp.]